MVLKSFLKLLLLRTRFYVIYICEIILKWKIDRITIFDFNVWNVYESQRLGGPGGPWESRAQHSRVNRAAEGIDGRFVAPQKTSAGSYYCAVVVRILAHDPKQQEMRQTIVL